MEPLFFIKTNRRRTFQLALPHIATAFNEQADYKKTLKQIIIDIPRARFIPTHDKNKLHFINDWLASFNKSYSQGDMGGGIGRLMFNDLLRKHVHSEQCETKNNDEKNDYFAEQAIIHLAFAFYNDNGLLCSTSICVSLKNATIWTAAIIQNVTQPPSMQNVLLLAASPSLQASEKTTESHLAAAQYYTFLESTLLEKQLENILSSDGSIHINALTEIHAQTNESAQLNINKDDLITQLKGLLEIKRQSMPTHTVTSSKQPFLYRHFYCILSISIAGTLSLIFNTLYKPPTTSALFFMAALCALAAIFRIIYFEKTMTYPATTSENDAVKKLREQTNAYTDMINAHAQPLFHQQPSFLPPSTSQYDVPEIVYK